jgi:hypothetical protein
VRIEELFLRLLPGDCGASAAGKATRAFPHQSLPGKGKLTFRNVAYGNVVHGIGNCLACHDDLLLLALAR